METDNFEADSETAKRIDHGLVSVWIAFTSGGPLERSFPSKRKAEDAAFAWEQARTHRDAASAHARHKRIHKLARPMLANPGDKTERPQAYRINPGREAFYVVATMDGTRLLGNALHTLEEAVVAIDPTPSDNGSSTTPLRFR